MRWLPSCCGSAAERLGGLFPQGDTLVGVPAYHSARPDEVMTDRVVDLRSDTVTVPTPEMRRAMATAEVGDDFLGEDPTAKRLEQRVNELFGAEASVFVPSGRMANIVALQALTQPGDEVICTRNAHFLHYEGAALAAVCGAQPYPLPDRRGGVDPEDVLSPPRPPPGYVPPPPAAAVEDNHHHDGGAGHA